MNRFDWGCMPKSHWAAFVLAIGLSQTTALAQINHCVPSCTGICSQFVTGSCPIGTCTSTTICNRASGVSCDPFAATAACSACGTGGYQTCSTLGVPSGICRPATLGAETCNGCDDDGDGTVDNIAQGSCALTNGCSGGFKCVGLSPQCSWIPGSTKPCSSCAGGTMACNIDGTFGACQPATSSAETCNSCDDDKNGIVDDVPSVACKLSAGCQGMTQCVGNMSVCTATPDSKKTGCNQCGRDGFQMCLTGGGLGPCRPAKQRLVEMNCDGCDEDWDGIADNNRAGRPDPLVRRCAGSGGACQGSQFCQSQAWSACSCSSPTSCTGFSNCNAFNTCRQSQLPRNNCSVLAVGALCTGACVLTAYCLPNEPAEACNGIDDNCDGTIDEGGVCSSRDTTCSCKPTTCAQQGITCGTAHDGCSQILTCGAPCK